MLCSALLNTRVQVFERIRDFGKYSEGAASVIFGKLARALLALHKAGIVHRCAETSERHP